MSSFITIMTILATIMGGTTLFFTICSFKLVRAETEFLKEELKL